MHLLVVEQVIEIVNHKRKPNFEKNGPTSVEVVPSPKHVTTEEAQIHSEFK